jgi:hypothetical protein
MLVLSHPIPAKKFFSFPLTLTYTPVLTHFSPSLTHSHPHPFSSPCCPEERLPKSRIMLVSSHPIPAKPFSFSHPHLHTRSHPSLTLTLTHPFLTLVHPLSPWCPGERLPYPINTDSINARSSWQARLDLF